jgi:NAD(P)-dependent dehydrogenase (short-subunit alcohol dehydrogenase family)
VIEITQCLAAEWGRSGVRVNAVSPGYTLTPALAAAIAAGERDPTLLEQTSALGVMVEPEDIAEAVCFLASKAARRITGINLPVDAGWLSAGSWASYGGLPPARGNS